MSPLLYVLLALVPYTVPNQKLSFKPNLFFNELEKLSGYSNKALRAAHRYAKHAKLVEIDDAQINLSLVARQKVQPFIAKKFSDNAQLMVIFDIPEDIAGIRRKFRSILINLDFVQIQQSVLTSRYDHTQIVSETIDSLELEDFVQIYESDRIIIK